MCITDLTGPTDSGWLCYYPINGFSVKGHEFAEMKEEAIRRLSCFSVAQGYEAFETFLKDTVARYLHIHQSLVKRQDVQRFEKQFGKTDRFEVTYWIEFVRFTRGTYGGPHNKKLFEFLRDVVPDLKVAERNNTRGMDLTKWYEAASVARHAITHSRLKIKDHSLKYFDKNDKRYFPCRSEARTDFLDIKRKHAENCLNIFAEYGFLIFKCLSKKEGYQWDVVKGMRTKTI